MNTFSLDISQSNKFKHKILFNDELIACFTNKKHAKKILNFLSWYESRFGAFEDAQTCAWQVHRTIKNANLKIRFETIDWY